MKKITLVIFFLCFSLLFAATTVIDTTKANRKIYKLEGIRVVAQREEQAIGNLSIKAYSADKTMNELDASEALGDFSGLDLAVAGKSGSELSIRGFDEESIKIMVDGRPLSNSYMDAVDLTTIPLTNIKEIQVIKGPISAIYGSNTMGGVINILTKSPKQGSELIFGSQFRRNNTNKFYLDWSQNFGVWDYTVSASRYHTDGFMLPNEFGATNGENGSVRDNNVRTSYDIQTKANMELFDFHKLGFQLGYTNMPTKEITSSIYENLYRQFTDWKRYQGSVSGFFQLRDNLEYNSHNYYDQYEDTYVEYSDPEYNNMIQGWPSELESWTFGSNNVFNWQINKFLKSSNGLRYEKNAYNRRDNMTYKDWTSNSARQFNYFMQNEIDQENFNFTFGSAISWFNLKDREQWDVHLQPSAAIYWKNSLGTKISVASGINTTYPSLRELYSNSHGNKDLEQETAWKSEINLDQVFVFGLVSGNVNNSFFYNDVQNLIERVGELNTNLKQVESYGFEVELNLYYLWEHRFQYSYLKYSDEENSKLIGTPQNSFTIKESVKLPWKINLDYSAKWKDERLTEISNHVLKPYWVHSITLNKKFDRYKLGFGLENILDESYQEKYGYPGSGINFIINFEVTI